MAWDGDARRDARCGDGVVVEAYGIPGAAYLGGVASAFDRVGGAEIGRDGERTESVADQALGAVLETEVLVVQGLCLKRAVFDRLSGRGCE